MVDYRQDHTERYEARRNGDINALYVDVAFEVENYGEPGLRGCCGALAADETGIAQRDNELQFCNED